MSEVRSELRLPFEVGVQVRAVLVGNPEVRLPCQLVEVSQSGVQVLVSGRISMDRTIRLQWNGNLLEGTPCYVRPTPEGYLVGLRLEGSSQWRLNT
jgi:hypothetical protein